MQSSDDDDVTMDDEALSTYYDCFNIRVEDIKIYLDADIPKNHLLTPLNMDSFIYSSIFPSDPKLPTIVLKAAIPKVDTKLASSDRELQIPKSRGREPLESPEAKGDVFAEHLRRTGFDNVLILSKDPPDDVIEWLVSEGNALIGDGELIPWGTA